MQGGNDMILPRPLYYTTFSVQNLPASLHGNKDSASVRIMGGWKVCVLPCDPDKIDRQECHTEYPAETGKESNRGEPHLSDHDGGTDRTENNV